jgi:hypothetical protein
LPRHQRDAFGFALLSLAAFAATALAVIRLAQG